jgi:hypothetical protein
MPGIGNNSDTLLQGLSGFWLRYFKDLNDFRVAYEGTEILFGQAYLDLITEVLNTSVINAPLFHREYFRLITIREDELVYRDTGVVGEERFVYQAPDAWVTIPTLQNKVFQPSALLEENIGYETVIASLRFPVNPLNINGFKDQDDNVVKAEPLHGYGVRTLDIGVSGLFTSGVNFYDLGIRNGDVLTVIPLVPYPTITVPPLPVLQVEPGRLVFAPGYTLPADPAILFNWSVSRTHVDGTTHVVHTSLVLGSFIVQSTLPVQQISFWAVDGRFDEFTLFQNFGSYFSRPQVSSESYRSFLRGIMQLYVLGPAIQRVESALNVVAGFPVIQNDIETFVSYSNDLDMQRIVTDRGTYEFPLGVPLRPDVIAETATTFRAFDPLTVAIYVTDYIRDPRWWYRITVPVELLPERTVGQRQVTDLVYPNLIGPEGQWIIGDPGVYVGADEDGNVRSADPYHATACFRHATPFYLMSRYLKTHLFQVTLHPSVEFSGVQIQDMQDMLRQVKPTHTMVYFSPVTKFTDTFLAVDTLFFTIFAAIQPDLVVSPDSRIHIGSAWNIGDGFKYDVDLTLTIGEASLDPTLCPIVVGGEDPNYTAPTHDDESTYLRDLPLYVHEVVTP